MDSQISKSKNNINDNNILNEHKTQDELKKALNSFQDDELIAAKVIECEYTDVYSLIYNESKYNISKNKNTDSFLLEKGDSIYLPVIVLNYGGTKQTFTSGWYSTKESANEKLRSLEKYYGNNINNSSFRYYISSNSEIIHSKTSNKIFEKIKLSKLMEKADIDSKSVFAISFMFILILYTIALFAYISLFGRPSSVGLHHYLYILGFSYIVVKLKEGIMYVNTLFEDYETTNINSDIILKENELENRDVNYKSIEVDVDINKSGLTIYSEKLDCTWTYDRHENNLLDKSGRELVQKLSSLGDEYVITVKDAGYSDSKWVSSNGDWWIDIESSFN